jgi:uncharacterized protein
MLRSFRVANHRSIHDEQQMVLLPAYDKSRSCVPVAALYGSNAAGKSNVLDALQFMQTAVRESYAEWEPDTGVPRHPFRMTASAAGEPSTYEVDFLAGEVRYVYGFAVDDRWVVEEWLHSYPQGRRRVLFERDGEKVSVGPSLATRRTRLLEELTRDNALFLSLAARSKLRELVPVYGWFQSGLRFLTSPASIFRVAERNAIRRLRGGGPRRQALVDLVRAADLGISDLRVTDADVTTDIAEPQLLFVHGAGTEFTLGDESLGTRTWLRLVTQALPALEQGSVFVVDELDRSLHPQLTAHLVTLFQDQRSNPAGAQLICTTHDAALLGGSLGPELLRRDQIWFVEKDQAGATRLYPLTDFHPREKENRERRYLGGSYGAVPLLSDDAFTDAVVRGRDATP